MLGKSVSKKKREFQFGWDEMSLIEINSITGKKCQNQDVEGHVYPKTLIRKRQYESVNEDNERHGTFIVTIKNTKEIGVFCYHCCFKYIGKCIADLKKYGATEEQIQEWINPNLRLQSQDSVM